MSKGRNSTDSHASPDDFERVFADVLSAVPDEYMDCSQFVPGVGSLDAKLMFVGEAPGGQEVANGLPFVGPAGRRLDRTLDKLGVDRDDLYITNVVKVRPPKNRTPHVAEIEAWANVLDAEIREVHPEVVVPLGTTATRAILDIDEGITTVHGERFERNGRVVVPAYHPAATLYDPSKSGDFEADLRTALENV